MIETTREGPSPCGVTRGGFLHLADTVVRERVDEPPRLACWRPATMTRKVEPAGQAWCGVAVRAQDRWFGSGSVTLRALPSLPVTVVEPAGLRLCPGCREAREARIR